MPNFMPVFVKNPVRPSPHLRKFRLNAKRLRWQAPTASTRFAETIWDVWQDPPPCGYSKTKPYFWSGDLRYSKLRLKMALNGEVNSSWAIFAGAFAGKAAKAVCSFLFTTRCNEIFKFQGLHLKYALKITSRGWILKIKIGIIFPISIKKLM